MTDLSVAGDEGVASALVVNLELEHAIHVRSLEGGVQVSVVVLQGRSEKHGRSE